MQHRFLIDDVLLRSGDNRDQVAKLSEIALKFSCFGAAKFRGDSQFLTEFYKFGSPWNVVKFGDDRPSDFAD